MTGAGRLAPLARRVGYRLGDQAQLLLERALRRASEALSVSEDEAQGRILEGDPAAFRAFSDAVAIHETYFFRHPEHFRLVQAHAKKAQEDGAPFTSAWSVGCSTGEEAWSLLLALWPYAPGIRVLGSDLSQDALAFARAGRYPPRAFRDTHPTSWPGLVQASGEWEPSSALRERATFAHLNLAEGALRPPPPLPHEVDVIFCRNVLVYLTADLASAVFRALADALSDRGLLIVGAVEVPPDAREVASAVEELPGAFQKRPPRPKAPAPARPKARPRDAGAQAQPPPPASAALGWVEKARALADQGRLEEALQAAARAGDAPAALYLSAAVQLELGNVNHAGALLNRLVRRMPDSVPVHLQLALVAQRRGDARGLSLHRQTVQRLLDGRADEEDLGLEGMRAAWARQVLSQLGAEALS